jgi:hypothetical protein
MNFMRFRKAVFHSVLLYGMGRPPSGRIFLKFRIWGILTKLDEAFSFWPQLNKTNIHCTWSPKSIYIMLLLDTEYVICEAWDRWGRRNSWRFKHYNTKRSTFIETSITIDSKSAAKVQRNVNASCVKCGKGHYKTCVCSALWVIIYEFKVWGQQQSLCNRRFVWYGCSLTCLIFWLQKKSACTQSRDFKCSAKTLG